MAIERKIEALTDILKTIHNKRQQLYAVEIINELVSKYNLTEKQNVKLKSKRVNLSEEDYYTYIEKCSDILQALEFDQIDIFEVNKKAVEFIKKNSHWIKKPMTKDHFMNMCRLYEYHCRIYGCQPKNLNELANALPEKVEEKFEKEAEELKNQIDANTNN